MGFNVKKNAWIKNTGKEPNLPNGAPIKVQLRNITGNIDFKVGGFDWVIDGDIADILAYKLRKRWKVMSELSLVSAEVQVEFMFSDFYSIVSGLAANPPEGATLWRVAKNQE